MRIMRILVPKHALRTEIVDEIVDEIKDFPDIIYRNNNYVKNLHATGNNENKNIMFIQQFYIPKQCLIAIMV